MKAADIQKKSLAEARKVLVEIAEDLAPLVRKLTTAELSVVLGAVQLGYARGMLDSATMLNDKMGAMLPKNLAESLKRRGIK